MARTVRAVLRIAIFAALLALPAEAIGSVTCAPPGVSGVSQYVETLPGLSCSVPSPHPGRGSRKRHATGGPTQPTSGSGPTQGGSLPAATSQQLSQQGAAGQAVQRLVAQTGTAPRRRARSQRTAVNVAATFPAVGSGAVGGVLHPLLSGSTQGGTGVLLPLFLAAALLVVLAMLFVRRRRRTAS